ncbi:Zinc finger RING/FYVE/PHD-type protein [Dioscorea alata]|uniref:Zinc finger RING/FYVE/PHD-type protein n=1 Tax=Dioscorea alata TaxID=55571 RepID=A0ACB7VMQ6_DIOAL|nr:Zinc finger RING/FYVE/PHD-type protein [Dioscorea alata]
MQDINKNQKIKENTSCERPTHLSETRNRTLHKPGIVLLSRTIIRTPSESNPRPKPFVSLKVSASHQLIEVLTLSETKGLGRGRNNECPACRTHCASRRSLRDDPNYDSLISALYPDIDKYEEEELAFHDEEKTRNKKIQASIAETFRRQTEALGRKRSTAIATAVAFVRRSNYRNAHGQSNYLRGRSRTGGRDTSLVCSDEEEDEDVNGNDGCKDSSSADERSPDVRPKRCKRWSGPRSSPARTSANADIGSEENDDLEASRETMGTSPLIAGNGEMLAWGKNGARSQTRHGNNASGSTGRFIKGGRMSKMVEFLRNLDEKDAEFDLHVTLLPLDETLGPQLEQPYLCCRPTLSVRHLSQFIALQLSVQAEQVDIFI